MVLFTSESVSKGHPDKVADQISDAVLDSFIAGDPQSHVAVETLVTTGQVVMSGEVRSNTYVDLQKVARDTIKKIGYDKAEYKFEAESCGILAAIHEQSHDINRGVYCEIEEEQGAGDQGMMFGYAVNETGNYMPVSLELAHLIVRVLTDIREEGVVMKYLRPDAKSQVTIQYDDCGNPQRIHTIVVSTQHDEFASDNAMLQQIRKDVVTILIPRVKSLCDEKMLALFNDDIIYHVNPTGKFVIGGPHGDTGLTGRKIIVDTYGGKGAHGGGAFSGKDPSKVDRSAAYMARYIAKNMVAAGVSDEILIQISYAIGVADPVSVYVNTFGKSHVGLTDSQLSNFVMNAFNLRPKAIERKFNLRTPIYEETASLGHFGRKPKKVTKVVNGKEQQVELFPWEKLDSVEFIKFSFHNNVML